MYLIHNPDNIHVLYKDNGVETQCPFTRVVIVQAQVMIGSQPCCSTCPFFVLHEPAHAALPNANRRLTLECTNREVKISRIDKQLVISKVMPINQP